MLSAAAIAAAATVVVNTVQFGVFTGISIGFAAGVHRLPVHSDGAERQSVRPTVQFLGKHQEPDTRRALGSPGALPGIVRLEARDGERMLLDALMRLKATDPP
jgi:hypothetical protein